MSWPRRARKSSLRCPPSAARIAFRFASACSSAGEMTSHASSGSTLSASPISMTPGCRRKSAGVGKSCRPMIIERSENADSKDRASAGLMRIWSEMSPSSRSSLIESCTRPREMWGRVACLTRPSRPWIWRGRFATISTCFRLTEAASTLAVHPPVLWVPRPKPVIDCMAAIQKPRWRVVDCGLGKNI